MTSEPVSLVELLRRAAEQFADHGYWTDGLFSYAELDRRSTALGIYFRDQGVRPGDRLLMLLPNCPELLIACFAAWKVRAVVIAMDTGMKVRDLREVLSDAEPVMAIVDGKAARHLSVFDSLQVLTLGSGIPEPAAPQCPDATPANGSSSTPDSLSGRSESSEVVSLSYTSGSTGKPKAVMHTHASWIASAMFTANHVALTNSDRMLISLPLHHAFAFRQVLAYMFAGADVVLAQGLIEGIKRLARTSITSLLLVPASCNMLLQELQPCLQSARTHLRYVEVGSGALEPDRLAQLKMLFPDASVFLPYGLTEARVGYVVRGPDGKLNRLSVIAPGLEVCVLDSAGNRISHGQGQIALRGRGLMCGYWRRESPFDSQSWFHTGDLGKVTAAGDVLILGRFDSIVKIAGHKVQPRVIEEVLARHPAVLEAVVVPVSSPGALVEYELHAYVALQSGCSTSTSALLRHCRRYLAPYEVPAHIHFRTSLPKSTLGKVQRCKVTQDVIHT